MATVSVGSKGEAFQLEGQTWTCKNELPSDIIINIGEISFHLHKFPLLTRSGLLRSMINDPQYDDGKSCVLDLHDLPGGPKSFELVSKFCYDIKFELTAHNVVSLRCASEHLCMSETYGEHNLIQITESFLSDIFETNWKETIRVLESCESLLPHSENLQLLTRCIESLASKACSDPIAICSTNNITNGENSTSGVVMWNGIAENPKSPRSDWWYEDVSFLNLPLYKRLMLSIKAKGMMPELVAGSLKDYAMKHIPTLKTMHSSSISAQAESEQRSLVHEIVELLPTEKGVTSTSFLVGLLKAAMILHANPSCSENLEKRIGAQLEEATLEDILIPNLGYSVETLYDIDCLQRIVDNFVSANLQSTCSVASSPAGIVEEEQYLGGNSSSLTPMTMVAKLVDSYLGEVACDVNLNLQRFQALAAAIPAYARVSDDGIYRAMDVYLKSHPWLPDSDREQLCQLMNCQKLSIEACTHAAQNERLPIRVIVQVLFFEQLRLRTTVSGWIYISDDMDNNHRGLHGDPTLPKSTNAGPAPRLSNIYESQNASNCDEADADEVRSRISLLEKECSSLKKEVEKIGKGKGFWEKFCCKLRHHYHGKHMFMEC